MARSRPGPAATTTAAPTAAADLHLNVAEGRFRAQQMLQRLLLGRQRVLEASAFSLSEAGPIEATAASISFTNCWNAAPLPSSWRAFVRLASDCA